jgi:hypothetical protein
MPSIESRLRKPFSSNSDQLSFNFTNELSDGERDAGNYTRPHASLPRPSLGPVGIPTLPYLSRQLICPLPIINSSNSDSLRQYYRSGAVPQYRFNPPPPLG